MNNSYCFILVIHIIIFTMIVESVVCNKFEWWWSVICTSDIAVFFSQQKIRGSCLPDLRQGKYTMKLDRNLALTQNVTTLSWETSHIFMFLEGSTKFLSHFLIGFPWCNHKIHWYWTEVRIRIGARIGVGDRVSNSIT